MDDPLGVGRLDRLGNLPRHAQRLLHGKPSPPQPLGERLSFDELQHEEVRPLIRIETVDGGDMGMVQGGQRLGFAFKAREALRIAAEACRQHLDRDFVAELGVGGAVHLTHAAFAELGGDPVVGERVADHFQGQTFPKSRSLERGRTQRLSAL